MESILPEQSQENFNFIKTKRSFDETFGDQMNETFKTSFNFTPNTSSTNMSSNVFLPFANLANPNNQLNSVRPNNLANLNGQFLNAHNVKSFDKKHKSNNQFNNQFNGQQNGQLNNQLNRQFNNQFNNQLNGQFNNQLNDQSNRQLNETLLSELKNINSKINKLVDVAELLSNKINLIETKLNEIYGHQHETFGGECSYIN